MARAPSCEQRPSGRKRHASRRAHRSHRLAQYYRELMHKGREIALTSPFYTFKVGIIGGHVETCEVSGSPRRRAGKGLQDEDHSHPSGRCSGQFSPAGWRLRLDRHRRQFYRFRGHGHSRKPPCRTGCNADRGLTRGATHTRDSQAAATLRVGNAIRGTAARMAVSWPDRILPACRAASVLAIGKLRALDIVSRVAERI